MASCGAFWVVLTIALSQGDISLEMQSLAAAAEVDVFTLACTIIGDPEEARHHPSAALAPAERLHDYFWLTSSLWGQQFVRRMEGNWEAARETSDRLLPLGEAPRSLAERVLLEYEQGDLALGKAHLDRLLRVHREMMPTPTTGYVMPALIIPLIKRIDPEADHLDYAHSLAEAVISS